MITSNEATYFQYTCNSLNLCSILLQTYFGVMCLNRNPYKRNLTLNQHYYFSKLAFVICNILEYVFCPLIHCRYFVHNEIESCKQINLTVKMIVCSLWNLLEIYFCYIVYSFFVHSKLETERIIIDPEEESVTTTIYGNGRICEVMGFRVNKSIIYDAEYKLQKGTLLKKPMPKYQNFMGSQKVN